MTSLKKSPMTRAPSREGKVARAREALKHFELLLADIMEREGLMGDEATELAFKEIRWMKRNLTEIVSGPREKRGGK